MKYERAEEFLNANQFFGNGFISHFRVKELMESYAEHQIAELKMFRNDVKYTIESKENQHDKIESIRDLLDKQALLKQDVNTLK